MDRVRWLKPEALREFPIGHRAPRLGLIHENLLETILQHDIATSLRASTRVLDAHMRRVTGVAPTILRADVHDQRFWVLSLGLEGGDERVLGVHHDVVHFPVVFEPRG